MGVFVELFLERPLADSKKKKEEEEKEKTRAALVNQWLGWGRRELKNPTSA